MIALARLGRGGTRGGEVVMGKQQPPPPPPRRPPPPPRHIAVVFDGGRVEAVSSEGDIVNLGEIDFEILEKLYRLVNAARIQRLRTMPYEDYLRTAHWQMVSQAELQRAGYRCCLCNAAGQDPRQPIQRTATGGLLIQAHAELNVHHRTYERRGCELPDDVITLCRKCHERHHGIHPPAPDLGP
jgi:hypothetical protein